jgi:hypothetical protein
MRAQPPQLTWTDVRLLPDPVGLNSVVGLADGGFVTIELRPRSGRRRSNEDDVAGENNGELWEWHTASGWEKVPGSESAGANGLEISNDGKWLYIGGWGSQSVIRLSRGQTPVKRDSVPAGFRVDNVRLTPDGSILAAGQGGAPPAQMSHVGQWNPTTMKFQELIRIPMVTRSALAPWPSKSARRSGSAPSAVIESRSSPRRINRSRQVFATRQRRRVVAWPLQALCACLMWKECPPPRAAPHAGLRFLRRKYPPTASIGSVP